MEIYIDDYGIEHESYEAYCNSKDLDPDVVGVMLSRGKRTPQNEYEKRLLKEIRRIEASGKGVEFNFN